MPGGLRAGAGIAAAMLLAPVLATTRADAAWTIRRDGQAVIAESPSRTRGATLRLSCAITDGEALWLAYVPPPGWRADRPVAVRIGPYRSAMVIDGTDDASLISNRPDNDIGITRTLIEAMRAGGTLVIEGPAASAIPAGRRSFALAGIAPALEAVEASCRPRR